MKNFAPLLAGLSVVSCHIAPTVKYPDGTIASLGASFLENSKSEEANLKMPNGTTLVYQKVGKNQTLVANRAIGAWATVASIIGTADGLNEGELIREKGMTARTISGNSVEKAKVAADVTKSTFVSPQ